MSRPSPRRRPASARRPAPRRSGLTAALLPSILAAAAWGLGGAGAAAQCETGELFASDRAAGDQFGIAVALDGSRLLVGANRADTSAVSAGAAYVYEESGGAWVETAKLEASDADVLDRFGLSVALFGDMAVVGARYNQDAGYGTGSVYVFRESGGVWTEEQKLLSNDLFTDVLFGSAVWTDGARIVVGADRGHGNDISELHVGSVHVFEHDGNAWVETAKLNAPLPQVNEDFGTSIAGWGDRILIGARNRDGGIGAAHVFDWDGGAWVHGALLQPADPKAGAFFGFDVALEGRRALVGALVADGAEADAGAAYLFEESGGVWSEAAKLTAPDGESGDFFGTSVSLSGRRALVGAWGDDDGGASAGAAYLFERTGAGWVFDAKLRSADPDPVDIFGHDVRLDGGRALVTSKSGLDDLGDDTGSVTVLDLRGSAEPYGAGCPGLGGFVPGLALDGCKVPGGDVTLRLTDGPGGAPALLMIGLGQDSVPLGGGCTLLLSGVLPNMILLALDGAGPGDGTVELPSTLPASAPAVTFHLQALVGDASAPSGHTTTHGLSVTIEP